MSEFEDEILADLGRYRETENAVMERVLLNQFREAYQPVVNNYLGTITRPFMEQFAKHDRP